jgi:hypothetical protein
MDFPNTPHEGQPAAAYPDMNLSNAHAAAIFNRCVNKGSSIIFDPQIKYKLLKKIATKIYIPSENILAAINRHYYQKAEGIVNYIQHIFCFAGYFQIGGGLIEPQESLVQRRYRGG